MTLILVAAWCAVDGAAAAEFAASSLVELRLLQPAWSSLRVHRESSVLLQMEKEGPLTARLAFPAAEIIEVATAGREHRFQIDRDFTLSGDGRQLVFTRPEPIAPIAAADLFLPPEAPHGYKHRVGQPNVNLLYRPGRWFHDRNIEITYWRKEVPAAMEKTHGTLPKTLARLQAGQPLTLGVSGDSISTGADASGLNQAAPHQPGYAELVRAQLQATFGSEVKLKNRAVGGWSVANGVDDLDKLLAEKPDLIIVAYGMNDVGRRDPKWFGGQTRKIVERIQAASPEIEIILVSSMLGNAEWVHTPREMFALYRDELRALTGPGVALADVTFAWQTLLQHKHDLDFTGNGLNHPNDFGHRVYAQAILALFTPWRKLPTLPDREGFAGSFAGVSHGALLVAGGANFPDKKPWEGGTKIWYDHVFVLEKPTGDWKVAGQLPRPLGYGVSVTHGAGMVCVGGSNAERHFAETFRLEWTGGRLVTTTLPSLPHAVANGCGALVGDTLYVAGGQERPDSKAALASVFRMHLAAAKPKWEEIEPCPGGGRILAVAAASNGVFYVAGGAELRAGEGTKVERRYLTDAYSYQSGAGWRKLANLPYAVVAAPSPAPSDAVGFTILGGDDGSQAGVSPSEHRGFLRNMLRYESKANAWFSVGEVAAPRVTAPCVAWEQAWIVPSGEARPGVRSPEVWSWHSGSQE